jgi:hypothetical protein
VLLRCLMPGCMHRAGCTASAAAAALLLLLRHTVQKAQVTLATAAC